MFIDRLCSVIHPLYQIAYNQGFRTWCFSDEINFKVIEEKKEVLCENE
ncbi:MAG: hypothetical protein ACRC7N_20070 [Clostridium sp.]